MKVMNWLLGVSFWTWLATMVLLPFAIGGITLFMPFLPGFTAYLKTVTLYDFFTIPAFWYAILMCLVGVSMGLAKDEGKFHQITAAEKGFTVVAIVIFLALIVGRFML